MFANNLSTSPPLARPNADLLTPVKSALWRSADLRSLDYASIDVEVRAGEVFLRGHVRSGMHKHDAGRRAAAVRGVTLVHNELVADTDLTIAVAQALAAHPATRDAILRVGASAGWIQLSGEVLDAQAQAQAEAIAASVPTVRGVLSLPHWPGKEPPEPHRILQPRIGTAVYAQDGLVGKLAGVVIDPRCRLVSQIILQARLDLDGQEVRGQILIPAEAIKLTSASGTQLNDSTLAVNARPRFDPADFCQPPADWRLPFPYLAGEVDWPASSAASAR